MSDYQLCKVCGHKYLVWERVCPACKKTEALEQRIAKLTAAAQKCVDETVGVIGCDALEELAKVLEDKQ